MSDNEETASEEKPFCVDRAKQGRAACKKCKEKCLAGEIRIAKVVPSPFGAGKMKNWHHLDCIFEQFLKQRVTTKRIESPNDVDGWDDLSEEDKKEISKRIEESENAIAEKYGIKASPKKPNTNSPSKTTPNKKGPARRNSTTGAGSSSSSNNAKSSDKEKTPSKATHSSHKEGINKDLLFKEFRRLVCDVSNVNSYIEKSGIVSNVFTKGSDGKSFKGNITQWCRLLLPGVVKRVYNLQNKQLIKLFSKIFSTDQTAMLEHSKQGDISETIQEFFQESKKAKPIKKSILTIQEVDDFLEELSKMTKEDEQMNHFKTFVSKCTANDLKIVVRLVTHDLRMNAGAKHILDGVHPDAYSVYQSSRDLDTVINRCLKTKESSVRVKASINLMTPVQPMLAEACKSVEQAMKKCPNGMFAEIKYDGERVQLHKHGSDFKYFSRNLKPVLSHKVSHFKDYIPQAFPHAKDLILDSEILMIDTISGKPLPFGTLGVHKKNEFKDANVCLFVFDCLFYNGESLVKQPIEHRKKILQENMTEIPNRIMFSEMEIIKKPEELSSMIAKVLEIGLEGLVLKDTKGIYEPGKRHWLKVKKDYLHDGAMADTADLIVLGAWYGTGKKGGMMSVFLMGCYDPNTQKYYTVTKVHTGHDDKTLEQLQTELKMVEISADPTKVPSWLKCTKTMIPDFVAENPKKQPVWEITGAEFTQHEVHTADGISIRFPRVTKIRHDKNWKTATTLEELKTLYQNSKENIDVRLLMNVSDKNDGESSNSSNNDKTPTKAKKKQEGSVVNPIKTENKSKRKTDHSETKIQVSPKRIKAEDPEPIKQEKENINQDINSSSKSEIDSLDKIKDPLPNVFDNIMLLVENGGQEEFEKWLRYFTAYGGVLLKPEEWKKASHVLHLEDSVKKQNITCPKSARHVIVEWIKDSISNNSLQDFRPYSVRWEPLQINDT
ncbi:hypothetical protein ILUMI_05427 [Ignelater luminosus]|uniref:DNA ligase n=1 Tax=Ignelater luminosus TaxID=2038154 RepID=A0A8K0D7R0_IGNLU|nr:hypothetical protein ILUMI_05427 [Ignelater luminosus]